DVIDVRAYSRQNVDARQVACSKLEVGFDLFTVDDENLAAPTVLAEYSRKSLGLGVFQREAFNNNQTSLSLSRQSHTQTKSTDLLVQRGVEFAATSTVSLTTTDENRRCAVAVTSGTTTLLTAKLLA